MNVFSFTGNIGKDCRKGGSGNGAYCGFSVAVKAGYGDKEQTNWVDCTLWGSRAEGKLPDYLLKGQAVAVTGELGTREHEGKVYLTCRVASIDLIGGKQEGSTRNASAPQPKKSDPMDEPFDDQGIPF